MESRLSNYLKAAFLATSLTLSGCGAGSTESSLPGSPVTQSAANSLGGLYGRVFLGTGIANVRVSVVGEKGGVLASATTDGNGFFAIPWLAAPESFRVVADVSSDYAFATEVRGYNGKGRYVVVNVPTSLVSAYLQAVPGESLQTAEQKVADFLGIPAGRDLEYGIEESVRAPFSHIAFFAQASVQGGWPSLRERLVQQLNGQNGKLGPFLLNRKTARLSLAGLNPSVLVPLENLRGSARFRRQLVSEFARPVSQLTQLLTQGGSTLLESGSVLAKRDVSVLPRVLTTIVGATASTVKDVAKDQIIDIGWTHIADALNLNYGTTTMLENIQEQLSEIQAMINDLDTQLKDDNLQQANNDLASQVSAIQALANALLAVNAAADLASPETPFVPSADLTTLKVAFSTFTASVSLSTIQKLMLGTGGTTNILTSARDSVNDRLGVSPTSGDQGFAPYDANAPFRNNDILAQMLESYEYYSQSQQVACTGIGEISHINNANPISDMLSAANTLTDAANSLKQQRGQLPQYLLSDDIIVDLQAGLMWYRYVQAPDIAANAENFASNFELDSGNGVVYQDWHVATPAELELLQDRARFISTDLRNSFIPHDGSDSSYGNYGYSTQGLEALGFDLSSAYMDSDGNLLAYQPTYNSSLFGSGSWEVQAGNFEFNHENPKFSKDQGNQITSKSYFLARTLGQPLLDQHSDTDSNDFYFPWTDIQKGEFAVSLRERGFPRLLDFA